MNDPNTAQRRAWARSLIRKAPCPPVYGSAEWLALPEGSAAKVSAVIIAAECWQRGSDNLEDRVRRQLDEERRAFKAAEDAEYQARAAEHRRHYRHLALVPARYVGQVARPHEQIGAEYMAQRRKEVGQ